MTALESAIEHLCKVCPPGSRVYTVLRRRSRSGMQHTLDLFVFNDTPDGKCREECITIHVAQALELPLDRFGSLVLRGHPPDAGFEVVSRLSRMLHGMLGKQDGRGPEKSIPCDVSGAPDYYSGYSLQQVWL